MGFATRRGWFALAMGLAASSAACRINPDCFANDECSGNTVCAEGLCVLPLPDGGPDGGARTPTWWQDIQPIVANNCLLCHGVSPVQGAPISIVTYENTQADRNGRPVYQVMGQRVASLAMPMPPRGQSALSSQQISLIQTWANAGAPEGPRPGTGDAGPTDADGGVVVVDAGGGGSPFVNAIPPLMQTAGGFNALFGATWADGANLLAFADYGASTINVLDTNGSATIFRNPSDQAAGLAGDQFGNLVAAEYETRRITRTVGEQVEVITNQYDQLPFNAPHDVVVLPDGTIFFTDPALGLAGRERGQDFNGLFRVTTDGTVFADWQGPPLSAPNGLEVSPANDRLFMSDSVDNVIRVFDIQGDSSLANERVFVLSRPQPAGMAVDANGNLFVAVAGGVAVYSATGMDLGAIAVPEQPANVVFGGPDRMTLFVLGQRTIYFTQVNVRGAR